MTSRFLVFEIFADLAHFKKPYTTMSMQTFSVPTGTAVIGMISAILGFDKNDYWKHFPHNSYTLAIGIKEPIKKVWIPFNTLKTTAKEHFYNITLHKQSNMEFVKDCRYRIWFSCTDETIFTQLETKLQNHESIYSFSLGLAWNLGNFEYITTTKIIPSQDGLQIPLFPQEIQKEVHSIIPIIEENKDITNISFINKNIASSIIPISMKNNTRELQDVKNCVFEINGKPIVVTSNKIICLANNDNIIPL